MRFAVEEINNSSSLLPNVSLGYQIFDHCSDTLNFPSVFDFLSVNGSVPVKKKNRDYRPKVISVTGPFGSTQTITIAPLFMANIIPMINHGSSSARLSDKTVFPSFLRTVPSDRNQVQLIILLLQKFGWNWVAFIGGNNDYSRDALQVFSEEIKSADICLAYQGTVLQKSPSIGAMLDQILQLKINVIVVFAPQEYAVALIETAIQNNVRDKVWIASDSWSLNPHLPRKEGIRAIGTVIGITSKSLSLPGLEEFIYRTMSRTDQGPCAKTPSNASAQTCNQDCPSCAVVNPKVIVDEDPTYTFSIYSAVYAVATALHQSLGCGEKGCAGPGTVHPYMVFEKLKKVNFTLHGRVVEFDGNGDPPAHYDVLFWDWTSSPLFKKIGSFSKQPRTSFFLNESLIRWHTNRTVPVSVCSEECKVGYIRRVTGYHSCCFQCEVCSNGTYVNHTADLYTCKKCEDDEWSNHGSTSCKKRSVEYLHFTEFVSIGLILSAGFLIIVSVAVSCVFACNYNTPVVKSAGGKMCFFMLSCLSVSCISVFAYIGVPGWGSCIFRNPVFALFYTACISCLAVRSFQIVFIFKMAAKLPRAYDFWVKHNGQWLIIVTSVVFQILLCGIWIGTEGPHTFNNTSAYKDQIILICDMGNLYAFLTVIAFVGCLSVACFIFSYMGTDLPKNYNEAKSITFSLLIFFLAWISYFTAQIVYSGKYIQAINAVSVLASLYGILFGYFIPKCYIIIFTPEKNTPAHFQTCIQSYTKTISSM
ncbi:taste receptor type 1 member 1-like [Amia ocellicauda]|uniref:taste receptor type 1 member 1-like n=1 Tax=Amia ocellicauda TaxID=2972642 RepID=UPI00346402C1